MGFFTRLASRATKALANWYPLRDYIITAYLNSAASSDTGQVVTPDVAMAMAAFYACVNVIATTIATLPICVVRTKDQKILDDHPAYSILNREFNPEMTAASGREAFMTNTLLWGNGFSFVERDDLGRVEALWPLRSQTTTPQRYPGSSLFYTSITGGANYTFTPDQILHLPDLSYDGIVGLSRVRYGANPIGLGLGTEKYAAKFFSNGGNPGGILELPPGMKKEAINEFKKSWRENFTGLENSLKTAILTDGMKYTRTGVEPQKSQMVDVRTFQVREIARLFRVPLHKIGDMEQATFSNIEQQDIEFMQDCIRPWAIKLEQEYNRKLLLTRERGKIEIRHDLDSLLRADTTTRYQGYHLALTDGWMTRNQVRAKEQMPPIDGGDTPLQQLNMGPANPAEPEKKPDEKTPPPPDKKKDNTPPADDPDNDGDNDETED